MKEYSIMKSRGNVSIEVYRGDSESDAKAWFGLLIKGRNIKHFDNEFDVMLLDGTRFKLEEDHE